MDGNSKEMLFEVSGIVAEGDHKATSLGYPTANIDCGDAIPSGIYAGNVLWCGNTYPAAVYKESGKKVVEAHLLDFSGNLYGETLTIRAFHTVRDGKAFPNQEELIAAIADDIATIKKLCSQE